MTNEIKLFSPATVANVACGFDVLGFCLNTVGDEMIIKKTTQKGVRITKIHGYDLPLDINRNVAGISALVMYNYLQPDCGFEIEIFKGIKPGSGIGSSSASAAGSVFGINALLDFPLDKYQLTKFALKGEAFASKAEHADNIAPGMFGGFTLVKSIQPLQIIALPTPKDLFATLIHPQIEIKTSAARALLPKKVTLTNAVQQWANVGSLVHALHSSDYNLLKDSLKDLIAEPHRKSLIPHYDLLKTSVLNSGALGCGISGSGPSVFALSKGAEIAKKVEETMKEVYSGSDIGFKTFISPINTKGIRIL